MCQEAEKAQFNDEADVAARRHREALAAQQERLREAYNELKYTAPDKVEAMRDQEMTRMQMNLAYRTGADHCEASCHSVLIRGTYYFVANLRLLLMVL